MSERRTGPAVEGHDKTSRVVLVGFLALIGIAIYIFVSMDTANIDTDFHDYNNTRDLEKETLCSFDVNPNLREWCNVEVVPSSRGTVLELNYTTTVNPFPTE